MRCSVVLLAACLLLASGLAGCLTDEAENGMSRDDPSQSTGPGEQASGPSQSQANSTVYRFGPENGSVSLALNGTFGPTDSCVFNACPSGPETDTLPITDALVEGQPVRVEAELTWTVNGPGNLDLSMERSDVEGRSMHWSANTTSETFEGFLIQKPGGEASFLVEYENPESAGQVSYQLQVNTTVLETRIPKGLATLVTVPAPATAVEVAPSDTSRTLRVWTPSDTYLGDRTLKEGETRLALPGEPGPYVVLVTGPSDTVQLEAINTTEPLDPLTFPALTYTHGEGTQLSPEGSATFTFEPSTIPVRVGLFWQPADDQAGAEANEAGSIAGPNGTLFTFGGTPGISVGGAQTWISPPTITPSGEGAWTGSYSAEAATPGQVGPVLATYERPG